VVNSLIAIFFCVHAKRGSSPTVREGGNLTHKRPPLRSGYCPDTNREKIISGRNCFP